MVKRFDEFVVLWPGGVVFKSDGLKDPSTSAMTPTDGADMTGMYQLQA